MRTYIPDLTQYSSVWTDEPFKDRLIAVGWLDRDFQHDEGLVPQKFIDNLEIFCTNPTIRTFGSRDCALCPNTDRAVSVRLHSGKVVILYGADEIRVPSLDGKKIYAAPDLILHYVLEHKYKPPQEFVDAVLYAPLPGTPEFEMFAEPWNKFH